MKPRHLPNLISAARLASVPVLVWLADEGRQDLFAWLLLISGFTDILDGWLARRYHWTSRLGAMLDSIADVLLTITAIFGLWVFHRDMIETHWPAVAAVCGTWLIVHLAAVIRYGRLASFHTRLTQAGLFGFGIFVLMMFFYQFVGWFYYLVATLCVLAGIENLVMIAMLAKWSPNLRGGLVGLLQRSRQEGEVPAE